MAIVPGTRLGNYQIRSAIGSGGQGEVYEAVDISLDRRVVIKVLAAEQTVQPASVERFQREAKLAASLDHPNICTIHGLSEVDGVRFIAMQYVEGRTVRQLVAGRPLELDLALSIAIQVAEALAAAHARGIIHRDIKAGNVMVMNSGRVKVLDFGLAKLLESSTETSHDLHLTALGVPYGTATYAAPEQAQGTAVDHRADIFSTGVLLYEMLAGTWPFKGKNVVEVRYAVMHHSPPPIATARGEDSSIIARLQEILDRALAKEPANRYQKIEEMRDALWAVLHEIDPESSKKVHFSGSVPSIMPRESLAVNTIGRLLRQKAFAFAAGVVLIAIAAFAIYQYTFRARTPAFDSLAVLPFVNVASDSDTEYLAEGMTESLINSLSQLQVIKVRSRNSVFRYKGRETDPQTVGRELRVRAVLTGRVEKRADELSTSVELIDTQDESVLWGERYTRRLSDLVGLQEELARDVAANLRLRLSGAEQTQLVKNYATNSEAYQLYLQGRYYWNKRTAAGFQKAIEYFNRVLEKDPNYAPAYSGLADCYWLLNVYNVGPATQWNAQARPAATKALALDETLAEAHASLASISYRYDWNWAEAEQHFKRAIQLRADYSTAHQWYSAMLAAMGRFDEANAEAKQAHELEPFSLTINSDVGRHLYYSRQFEPALAVHSKSVEMDQKFARAHIELGYVFSQMKRSDEAIAQFRQALELEKDRLESLAGLGYALAVSAEKQQARQVIEHLKELNQQRYVSPYHFAVIYAGLGERAQALDYLEKAADEHFNLLVFLKVEPMFDSLRSEPRFSALVRRVGLTP
jgi:serine/threonine-protein kinase